MRHCDSIDWGNVGFTSFIICLTAGLIEILVFVIIISERNNDLPAIEGEEQLEFSREMHLHGQEAFCKKLAGKEALLIKGECFVRIQNELHKIEAKILSNE